MIDRLNARLRSDEGFTLIELLVVIIILGILLAIAVPSYLSFQDRANKSAAQANVRSAIDSVESYNADNTGQAGDADNDATTTGYTGMTYALLKSGNGVAGSANESGYDQALSNSVHIWGDAASEYAGFSAGTAPGTTSYCVYAVQGGWVAWKDGPSNDIQVAKLASGGTEPTGFCTT